MPTSILSGHAHIGEARSFKGGDERSWRVRNLMLRDSYDVIWADRCAERRTGETEQRHGCRPEGVMDLVLRLQNHPREAGAVRHVHVQ
jgi:hypothetical protein